MAIDLYNVRIAGQYHSLDIYGSKFQLSLSCLRYIGFELWHTGRM